MMLKRARKMKSKKQLKKKGACVLNLNIFITFLLKQCRKLRIREADLVKSSFL